MVKVMTVACDVGHRAPVPCRRPRRRPTTPGPAGRCNVPVLRSREPTNASFQSSERPAADADTRAGSGRRGGSTVTMPRHDRNLPYGSSPPAAICAATGRADSYAGERVGGAEEQDVGAVGQHHERDDLAGLGLLERAREQQPGWAAPVLPTVIARSSTIAPSQAPSRFVSARTARACRPVTTTRSTCVGRQLGGLQRRVPRLLPERDVLRLAEALLPDLRAPIARRAPAVDELLGRRAAAEVLGDHRAGVAVQSPTSTRGRAVTARRLVRAGRAGRCAGRR